MATGPIVADRDTTAYAASFARHPARRNVTPPTQRAYLDGLTLLARFLTAAAMPTDVAVDELRLGERPADAIAGWTVWRA